MDKKFFNGLAIGCVATLIISLGVDTFLQNRQVVDSKNLTKLNQITSLIENKYYGEYTDEDILNGMFQGSCYNLDAYSTYLTLEDYEDAVDPDQEFGGIGVSSTYNKYTKVYKISYCYDNTPASRAGLKRNDIIEAVDGYDVYDMDLDKISELIRGKPGTTVSLKIDRDGELMDFDLVREHIELPYAYSYRISTDIGFIKITQFNGNVAEDFAKAMKVLEGCKGIVIDLRDNMGGVVTSYQDIMAQLVPSGVIQTVVRKDGTREDLTCESKLTSPQYKFVILCNNSTASCAESMTQALVDLAGAKTVGEETYGKGVAQEYFQVDDESVLRLTIGQVESPNGVVWNEAGIKPDVEVEYEYLGDDFEESVLLDDAQILAGVNLLKSELGIAD